jgi:hypothetical protein
MFDEINYLILFMGLMAVAKSKEHSIVPLCIGVLLLILTPHEYIIEALSATLVILIGIALIMVSRKIINIRYLDAIGRVGLTDLPILLLPLTIGGL